jgi:hypothetical protein
MPLRSKTLWSWTPRLLLLVPAQGMRDMEVFRRAFRYLEQPWQSPRATTQ